MKKSALKFISLFSFLAFALSFTFAVTVQVKAATYQSSASDYTYEADGSGIRITKYVGTSLQQISDATYSVIVPDQIDGHTVKSIAPYAFAEQKRISEFIIPETVTEIGDHAFYNCIELNKAALPANLTKIGSYAFYNTKLKKITIPKKVSSIGSYAFGCDGTAVSPQLSSVSVSTSNKKFASVSGILYNKAKTKLVYYPGANKSKSFTLPAAVSSITEWAFNDTRYLTTLSMKKSKVSALPDSSMQIATLSKVTLPSNLKKIGAHAFEKSNITSITIPARVTSIGEAAFNNCSKLKKVVISAKKLTTINTDTFAACRSLTSVKLPASLTTIGEGAFNNCISLKTITLPAKVTIIGDRAFRLCEELTKVTIKGNVTSIGFTAFDGDPKLTIVAKSGTYPESFAKQKGITFKAL